jgi:hypothetical protein
MSFFDLFAGTPSKDQFARLITKAIKRAGGPVELRYEAQEFRLITDDKQKLSLNLGNIYQEYCVATRWSRPQVLRKMVRGWLDYRKEVPGDFEDLGPDLLPTVRGRAYFVFSPLQFQVDGAGAMEWPYQPLADHLGVGLVYDRPDSMLQIQKHHLTSWGVTFEEALEVACKNLQEISHEPFARLTPGLWASTWSDSHGASRLILHDLIRDLDVKGDHIAMIPNRDALLVTGSEDIQGLAAMITIAEKEVNRPRSVSGVAFRLDWNGWSPYLPDRDHPLRARFEALRVKSISEDYSEQKALLDALHKKTGVDVYVAPCNVAQHKETQRSHTYCMWLKGIDSLLPKADQVYFFVPTGEESGELAASADWEMVEKVVGHLLEPADLYPERFRVKAFPTEEELKALGQVG